MACHTIVAYRYRATACCTLYFIAEHRGTATNATKERRKKKDLQAERSAI